VRLETRDPASRPLASANLPGEDSIPS
jgi:hypothetical protein